MTTKCYCGADILARNAFCDSCLRILQPLCKQFGIDSSLISFVLDNRDWLLKMSEECSGDWHGTLTLSVKQGTPTHARWQYTELLQKKTS